MGQQSLGVVRGRTFGVGLRYYDFTKRAAGAALFGCRQTQKACAIIPSHFCLTHAPWCAIEVPLQMLTDLKLMTLHVRALFARDNDDRLLRVNYPNGVAAPLFFLVERSRLRRL